MLRTKSPVTSRLPDGIGFQVLSPVGRAIVVPLGIEKPRALDEVLSLQVTVKLDPAPPWWNILARWSFSSQVEALMRTIATNASLVRTELLPGGERFHFMYLKAEKLSTVRLLDGALNDLADWVAIEVGKVKPKELEEERCGDGDG